MTRREVGWAEGRTVGVTETGSGAPTILLAHGAGAGQDHPFMAGMRDRLSATHRVVTFDYPYMAEGRRAPDRMPTLVACHEAVARSVEGPLVLGGKSMGGRMSSHLTIPETTALFFLGYPLVPIGKTEPRDTSHLDRIKAPMLFVQGERDRLGPPELVGAVVERLESATMTVIADADHGFKMPKRAGLEPGEVLDLVAETVTGWLAGV